MVENCFARFKMLDLVLVGESDFVLTDSTFGSKAFSVSADGSVVWPTGQLMHTKAACVSWPYRVKGSTMVSRFSKVSREPEC